MRHKVAMVGAFAVGKTSLVQRFVTGLFSDRYLTTVGVRIDKRDMVVDGKDLTIVLWDLEGEDSAHSLRLSHLRGSAGCLLVADGTRPHTLDTALRLGSEVEAALGKVPSLLLLNKRDLRGEWSVGEAQLVAARTAGHEIIETSALSGESVETAFERLALRMLRNRETRSG
ncbi:MAG: GTP-binding protein [Planctomycetes bacterium]|nr:GTP-binding protein [Planctomycetota bacterium]